MTAPARIGFVGLGNMGQGMAARIRAAGHPLALLAHRRRDAVEALIAAGATEAATPRDLAAASDIVILCVTGAAAVDDLVRRPDGIAAGAAPGTVVLDCTTSAPGTLLTLAADHPQLSFVDAPLGRSPKEAEAGTLSVMLGCDRAVLAAVRPVLETFATTIQHAGPPGSGHALKLVNNLVSLGYAPLYSEALVLAARAGLAPGAVDDLIGESRMNCAFFQTFMGWCRTGDGRSHPFALHLADKSAADIEALAREASADLPVLAAVRATYARALTEGMGTADLPELPRAVALANGLDPDRLRSGP